MTAEAYAQLVTRLATEAAQQSQALSPAVIAFARHLAATQGADAVLFYGSNLRTGELDGVLDFYLLHRGVQKERIWPRVSYHEWTHEGVQLRAKIAVMSLDQFAKAARGRSRDTTIWARFVQPAAVIWASAPDAENAVLSAIADAAVTAARFAAALGPHEGAEDAYWRALFRATYTAELRVEKPGREDSILAANHAHFAGLLPMAWAAQGIAYAEQDGVLRPDIAPSHRRQLRRQWARVRALGKPLNLLRLGKASTTFEGAADYAAWKIARHTGVKLEVTPFRSRHPLLSAPYVLYKIWRIKRAQKRD